MEVCKAGHEEIVVDARPCPLCESIERNAELLQEQETMAERIEHLQDQISALEGEA